MSPADRTVSERADSLRHRIAKLRDLVQRNRVRDGKFTREKLRVWAERLARLEPGETS